MSKETVFYSWQSQDVGIQQKLRRVIQDACKTVKCSFDDAIRGKEGTPNIMESLMAKIDKCSLYIGDVSLVSEHSRGGNPGPNLNVVAEFGYALKAVGQERILLLMAQSTGDPGMLPFDIRGLSGYRILSLDLNLPEEDMVKILIDPIKFCLARWKVDLRKYLNTIDERIMSRVDAVPSDQFPLYIYLTVLDFYNINKLHDFVNSKKSYKKVISVQTEFANVKVNIENQINTGLKTGQPVLLTFRSEID